MGGTNENAEHNVTKSNLNVIVVSLLEHHYRLFRLRLLESFPVICTCMNSQRKISIENCR